MGMFLGFFGEVFDNFFDFEYIFINLLKITVNVFFVV